MQKNKQENLKIEVEVGSNANTNADLSLLSTPKNIYSEAHPRNLGRLKDGCLVVNFNPSESGNVGKTTLALAITAAFTEVVGVAPFLGLSDKAHTAFLTVLGKKNEFGEVVGSEQDPNEFLMFDIRKNDGAFYNAIANEKEEMLRDKVFDFGAANSDTATELFKDGWNFLNDVETPQLYLINQIITAEKDFATIQLHDKQFKSFVADNDHRVVFNRFIVIGKIASTQKEEAYLELAKAYEEKFNLKISNETIDLGDGKYIRHHIIHTDITICKDLLSKYKIKDLINGNALLMATPDEQSLISQPATKRTIKSFFNEVSQYILSDVYFDDIEMMKEVGRMPHPLENQTPTSNLSKKNKEKVLLNKAWSEEYK